ncbi:DNA polymerase III subunit delta' [Sulfuricystis multivorans]|uniref:DNA polymerase III subunit delta' n=1 Tax=Sulfuricystis multivorans TaxID=2211108 RepID=UPI000F83F61F
MILNEDIWKSLTGPDVRLPHALLFTGPVGVGKRELADALAARLLCEIPRGPHEPACGRCPSCSMMANGQHPDFRLVQPEAESAAEEDAKHSEGEKKKTGRQIRIQQIRELEDFFHVGGHRGGARVCLIDPAEAMNPIVANSLLKILEEPSTSFYFIMISNRWRSLLPTLLSRSRRVVFAPPPIEQSRRWLEEQKLAGEAKWLPFFGQAPRQLFDAARSGRLKALEKLVSDLLRPSEPLALAARWEGLVKDDAGLGIEDLVVTVQKWLHDLGLCRVGHAPRYFDRDALAPLAQRTTLPALIRAQRQIAQLRAWANHPLNPRLFLEDLCLRAFKPLES